MFHPRWTCSIALLVLAGCGGEPKKVDGRDVASAAQMHILMKGEHAIAQTTCPDAAKVAVGGTLECAIEGSDGEKHPAAITVKAVRGDEIEVDVRLRDDAVLTTLIEAEVSFELGKANGISPHLECGEALFTRLPADRVLRCTATSRGGSDRTWDVEIAVDAAGKPTGTIK